MPAVQISLIHVVRRRLDDGVPEEDIVAELITHGLSESTASKFVERARNAPAASEPVRRSSSTRLAAAIGAAVIAIAVGVVWREVMRRDARTQAAAASQLAAADRARADQIRAESRAARQAEEAPNAERRQKAVAFALEGLAKNHTMIQCSTAMDVATQGLTETIPRLLELVAPPTPDSVRVCAAYALAKLGETDTAVATYTEWARSDDPSLRMSAISGFGEIGPSAASVGLPFIAKELESPVWDRRFIAVKALAQLGPDAIPLLRVASGDAHQLVRETAQVALAKMKQKP